MLSKMASDGRVEAVKDCITEHPDFPKPGISFKNIFPVLNNPKVFKQLIEVMTDHLKSTCKDVEVIVGLESRGFLFGPILAQNLNVGFVPIRKKGKLPGETQKVTYTLEYGSDTFEIQKDAIKPGDKVVVVDDLLATGGTMKAAFDLLDSMKANILEGYVIMELSDLNGRDISKGKRIVSIVQY